MQNDWLHLIDDQKTVHFHTLLMIAVGTFDKYSSIQEFFFKTNQEFFILNSAIDAIYFTGVVNDKTA